MDVDVGNDYADEWYDCSDKAFDALIAFCGPCKLTEEGKEEWKDIMNFEVDVFPRGATVHIPGECEEEKQKNLNRLYLFLYSAAGYCACSQFDEWFE